MKKLDAGMPLSHSWLVEHKKALSDLAGFRCFAPAALSRTGPQGREASDHSLPNGETEAARYQSSSH